MMTQATHHKTATMIAMIDIHLIQILMIVTMIVTVMIGSRVAHDVELNLPPPPYHMDPNPKINVGPQQAQPPADSQ